MSRTQTIRHTCRKLQPAFLQAAALQKFTGNCPRSPFPPHATWAGAKLLVDTHTDREFKSNPSFDNIILAAMAATGFRLPLPYTLFFLTIEPISALVGAFFASFRPLTYLQLTHSASAPLTSGAIPISTNIVLAQLANLYLLFAINEAFVLRATYDIRVWRTVLFGLLIADFGHLYSVSALGPSIYWNFTQWNAIDWGNLGFVYVGATMRLAFLFGVGLKTNGGKQPGSATKAQ